MRVSRNLFVFLGACAVAAAQSLGTYPPQMNGVEVEIYKTAGEVQLPLYLFYPKDHSPADKRPAIVFFFGGGWRGGTPQQFEQQCRHLASRGMVAITADYRVSSRHGAKVPDGVADARAAIGWVRQNAARLGVDPARIAAGGGSAGGHLAAAAGVIPGDAGSQPNALILFNPVLVLASGSDRLFDRPELAGVDMAAVSPFHHVAKGAPPAIIFHGKADKTVPYFTAEQFTKKMAATGNRCELVGYAGQDHGFFNYGRNGNQGYLETRSKMDEFLVSLGYLSRLR